METTGASSPGFNVSRARSLKREQLELAAKFYRQTSRHFGQVVAVDDDELPHFSTHGPQHASPADGEFVHGQGPPVAAADESSKSRDPTAVASGGKARLKTILFEQSWVTVYKRLFLASFKLNLIGLILAITGHFPYAKPRATLFSVANILMSVLARSEVFLRILFWLAVRLLGYQCVSVRLKTTATAFLQSVGGIHSGCGVAAVIWLVYALVESFKHRQNSSDGMLGVACGILGLLLLSCLAAFPAVRHIHHNVFERVHRFAGWSSLDLVWAYVVLSAFWDPGTNSYQITAARRTRLAEMQTLWLLAATTVLVVLPWLFVRKVAVKTTVPPSGLASELDFKGGVKPGLLVRISPSPFSEWHAFGIISDGRERHSVLAGAVGDFTKSLVDNPPTHIWVRTFHFAGLPYLTSMYQKALLVATGSGICVFLSFMMQPAVRASTDVHIIWFAKKIRESFGERLWEVIKNIPSERMTVIDTAVSGRPRTKDVVVTKVKEWSAEVVIVTSNPSGTNEIVSGCRAVGVPAFGPIWDS